MSDPIANKVELETLKQRIDRVEHRTDQIDEILRERRDHAAGLEVNLRELKVKTEGMNTTMQHVLTGITGNQKGIRAIENRIAEHVKEEQQQRAEDAEAANEKLQEDRRYRARLNLSFAALLVSTIGVLAGLWSLIQKLSAG